MILRASGTSGLSVSDNWPGPQPGLTTLAGLLQPLLLAFEHLGEQVDLRVLVKECPGTLSSQALRAFAIQE